jgi:hypothetical protein
MNQLYVKNAAGAARFVFGLSVFFITSFPALSQLQLTLPISRAVFQRGNDGRALVTVAGNVSQLVDRVEARFVARQGGTTTGWMTVQEAPQGGVFRGTLSVTGGWYNLEVRGVLNNNPVGSVATLERVGVGEVFLIAGQSNGQGLDPAMQSGQPESNDDRVNVLAYHNTSNSLADPPRPEFAKLTNSLYGLHGFGSWNWGVLGDRLAAHLNVPVLFINTAHGATTVNNWVESAQGQRTQNIYCLSCGENSYYPAGMPYGNLRLALNHYVPLLGVRAVLWHQGESDTQLGTTADAYAGMLRQVIGFSRNHSGKHVPWMVARVSLTEKTRTSPAVISGQSNVVNPGDQVFGGPFTDNVQNPRPDGVHFSDEGHVQHAQAWFDALVNSEFFNASQPQAPTPPPALAVTCNGANSLTFSLPGGFGSYAWRDGSGNTVSGGTSATGNSGATFWPLVKDGTGNAHWVQPASVPSSTLAAAPSVRAESALTVCPGTPARLTSSGRDDDLWSNGSVGRTITPTQPGSYTVRTRGVYGCYSEPSAAVSFNNFATPATPTVTASGPTTFCPENNVTLSAPDAAGYRWSNGSTSRTLTTNQPGAFSVKITDNNGCQSASSALVQVQHLPTPPAPSITASGSTTFCEGGEVTLQSSAASTYLWSNGATTPSVSSRTSGRFSLTVKDGNGCFSPRSPEVAVVVNALPSKPRITAQGSTTFCDGENVVLTASEPAAQPATYRWNDETGGRDLTVTRSGRFRLTVTDANGCSSPEASDELAVTVNPLPPAPRISAGGPTTFCPESNVTLTSTEGVGYRWSNGSTSRNTTLNREGSYTARISDANGCFSPPSNSIEVRLYATPPAPNISPSGPTTFCEGGEVTLQSSPASEYRWNNGSTSASVNAKASGNFSLIIKDGNGCLSPASATTTVVVNALPPKPVLSTNGPTTVCDGTTVVLSASEPPAQPATYRWSNKASSREIAVTSTGTFRLTVTDANGCTARDSSDALRVTVNPNPPKPVITASGPTTFCADQSVQFTAPADAAYRWSNGALTRSISINTTGRFSVQVINQFNCPSVASEVVSTNVNPLPPAPRIAAQGLTEFCNGDSVHLVSDNLFLKTTWNLTSDATSQTYAKRSGAYFAKVTDANGCVSPPSNAVGVDVKALPSTPVIARVGTYTLEATGVIEGDDYAWQRDGQALPTRTPFIKAGQEGQYGVRTRLTYAVPGRQLTCFSKPSGLFQLRLEPGDSGLSVFPNPSAGPLTVETREDLVNAILTLFTPTGQVIFSETVPVFNERKLLDLPLTPGLYFLEVRAGPFRQLRRIVVQR